MSNLVHFIPPVLQLIMLLFFRISSVDVSLVILLSLIVQFSATSYVGLRVFLKDYFSVGLRRFYVPLFLIHFVLAGCVIAIMYSFVPQKYHYILVLCYVAISCFIQYRTSLFIITPSFVIHKHRFSVIVWKLKSLDKVYINRSKVEFVKRDIKFKVAFHDDSHAIRRVADFLREKIGDKIEKKDEKKYQNFQ